MVVSQYFNHDSKKVIKVLKKAEMTIEEVESLEVIQYPDELLYALKQVSKKEVSFLLAELLLLENPGQIRKIQTDYSFRKALESEITYLFISQGYREEETLFLRDVFLEKNIFEPEMPVLARFNLFGREIYKEFLKRTSKSDEFNRLRPQIDSYFILAHDKDGTLLSHKAFMKQIKIAPFLK